MKKVFITLGIILAVFIGIALICSMTGMYKMYSIPTNTNEPAIRVGARIFSTNLREAKTGDFIIYNQDGQPWTHRFVADEGDVIQIKNGIVYVNDKDFDKGLSLMHTYILSRDQTAALSAKGQVNSQTPIPQPDGRYGLNLEDAIAKENGLTASRMMLKANEPEKYLFEEFDRSWNRDHFGPYTIPAGKVFVMGDNRDNSMDSRYVGCIDKANVMGTVIK